MRKLREARGRDDFLLRIARFYRSDARHCMCLLCSVLLLALGVGVFVYIIHEAIQRGGALILRDFGLGLVGLAGIFAGWLIRLALCVSRVAHEVLLRVDDDYRRAHRTEADRQQVGTIRKSAGVGLRVYSLSKSALRKLSTRDFTAGWCLLVVTPMIIGGLLLVFSIGAWLFPRLGDFVYERGVRMEYICLSGLVLMMIGAYLMPFGAILPTRTSRDNGTAL